MRQALVGLICAFACVFTGSASAGYLVAAPLGSGLELHASPGGPVVARVGTSTIFGTPVALGVVERRGNWLGVTSDALPNGKLGWVDSRTAQISMVVTALRVSLSKRTLDVVEGTQVVRSFTVAIGASDSPTPTGRFAVAEKLDGTRYGTVWGCCVLGLSAHQPHPPSSWSARDYLVAIHGGAGIGSAVSAGCLHLDDDALRYLMRTVPVGTPVFVTS